ncbi:MAG: response regulator [Phycisphaerales bacterium]|nr:response regulator [Phycisphaerales bacterium]
MSEHLNNDNVTDSLRMPQKEIERLLSEIDRSSSSAGSSRRRMRRRSMDGRKMVVVLLGANNERKSITAVGRNLSATGVGFLCGGFLHPGIRCVVALRDLQGKAHGVPGSITRCGHVKGHLHDIGVRFDDAIKPHEFIQMKSDDVFNIENVSPDELEGRLLVIEDSRADQRLLAHHLKGSKLELDFVGDGEGGLQSLGDQPDLVLIDYHLPDMTGADWVVKARENGLTRPVILVTADKSAAVHASARTAGCDAVITKPFTRQGLMQAIAEFLVGERSSRPQISNASLGLNRDLLQQYVNDLHKYADDIANSIEKQDIEVLRSLLLEIRGTAAGHGFASVSELAEDAATSLSASMDINEAMTDIQRLLSACQCARLPKSEENAESDAAESATKG